MEKQIPISCDGDVDFVFLARDTGTITRTIARSKVPGKPEIREYKEHRGVYAYPSPA